MMFKQFINTITNLFKKSNTKKNDIVDIITNELEKHKQSLIVHIRYNCRDDIYLDTERVKVCLNILANVDFNKAEQILKEIISLNEKDNHYLKDYTLFKNE